MVFNIFKIENSYFLTLYHILLYFFSFESKLKKYITSIKIDKISKILLIKMTDLSQSKNDINTKSHTKIRFITPYKQIENIPLNPITMIGNFQSLNQGDELRKSRLDEIDWHFQFLGDIIASRKRSGIYTNNKYGGPQILELHMLIFGNKGPSDKNFKIDNIVEFYTEKYVQRQTRDHSSTVINTTDTGVVLKSNSNIFGIKETDNVSDEDEDYESDEEIDF